MGKSVILVNVCTNWGLTDQIHLKRHTVNTTSCYNVYNKIIILLYQNNL